VENKKEIMQQQRILCITRTVKHNYILPISTVRIQLHVSVLYVDHLQDYAACLKNVVNFLVA